MQGSTYSGSTAASSPTAFKVLSVVEDDAFVLNYSSLNNSQCCTVEMSILHPDNSMMVWGNSTTVYGLYKKNTGVCVFNVSPIEPMLDCCLSSFVVRIRYKVDNDDIKEIIGFCDLLDPKTRIGSNVLKVEKNNEKMTMSFNYLGYIEEKQAFVLQNLSFALFIKKPKIQRAPTNRALSMGVNTYHNSLLTKSPNKMMHNPSRLASDNRAMYIPNGMNPNKVLKVSSNAYQPPMKMESSNSVASYHSMPVYSGEQADMGQKGYKDIDSGRPKQPKSKPLQ